MKRAVPKELFQEFDGLLTVNRIFVGGLRQEIQESHIREYFSSFGSVRKIDVMVDRNTNTKRGFAFVEFEDYDPVDKVVLQGRHILHGTEVTVRKAKSRLEMELVKLYAPKNARRKQGQGVPNPNPENPGTSGVTLGSQTDMVVDPGPSGVTLGSGIDMADPGPSGVTLDSAINMADPELSGESQGSAISMVSEASE